MPSYYVIANFCLFVELTDPDLILDFAESSYSVVENEGHIFVALMLSGATIQDIEGTLRTQSGTASGRFEFFLVPSVIIIL